MKQLIATITSRTPASIPSKLTLSLKPKNNLKFVKNAVTGCEYPVTFPIARFCWYSAALIILSASTKEDSAPWRCSIILNAKLIRSCPNTTPDKIHLVKSVNRYDTPHANPHDKSPINSCKKLFKSPSFSFNNTSTAKGIAIATVSVVKKSKNAQQTPLITAKTTAQSFFW